LREFRSIYRRFRGAKDLRDIFRLRAELRRARIALENYIVSVRESPVEEDEYGMRVVHREEVEAYYDMETGFRLERGVQNFGRPQASEWRVCNWDDDLVLLHLQEGGLALL